MQCLWFLAQIEELTEPPRPGHLVQASPTACKRFGRHVFRIESIDESTNTMRARPLVEAQATQVFHVDQVATVLRTPFDAGNHEAIERMIAYNKLLYGDVAQQTKRRRRKAAA